jgi:hypothetical protein
MKLQSLLAPLALALAFASPTAAQCLVPDNLDLVGSPCGGAQTNVPQRAFQQGAVGICWQDCGIDATGNYIAQWQALTPILGGPLPPVPSCAWYKARLRLYNGFGLQWDGQMFFNYSRTWAEVGTSGTPIQVWRYLVNGDLRAVSPSTMPCGTPACAGAFGGLVRFTGYVDYAYDCATTVTRRAWMITHACDAIDHVAGFPRAGTFHPNRYYTFVGPSGSFVVGAGTTIEAGGATVECVRKWDALAVPARCNSEEPLITGNITPNVMNCMCGTGPANWYEGNLFVGGAFGTVLTGFPGSQPFRSFPVGQWTNPGVFPGVEEVRWNCNEGQWLDCNGVARQEFYFGVTTAGGFSPFSLPTSTPPMPLPTTFVDQSNSMILPANIATRNRIYRSDHIINLNF